LHRQEFHGAASFASVLAFDLSVHWRFAN